ncbi:MAG: DUF2783 domain-containing protein [Robiginitomaculum sp.]|nr:DUF2783 domain-containing protein [Robiginitomaculum sp.]
MKLNTKPNIRDHDNIYDMITDLHHNMTDDESMKANAKLVLLLANHIGDSAIIKEAIDIASQFGK